MYQQPAVSTSKYNTRTVQTPIVGNNIEGFVNVCLLNLNVIRNLMLDERRRKVFTKRFFFLIAYFHLRDFRSLPDGNRW